MKKGDRVICTNIDGIKHLSLWETFEVLEVFRNSITIKRADGEVQWYYSRRFELAPPPLPAPKFKPGDWVTCINNSDMPLTLGAGYQVVNSNGLREGTEIANDDNVLVWFDSERFMLKSDYETSQMYARWMQNDQEPGKDNILRVGDTVVLTRQMVEWYRHHFGFLYSIATGDMEGYREFRDDVLDTIVFWIRCYKENVSPVGKVYGYASTEDGNTSRRCVRVRLNRFGYTYETILDEKDLIRIGKAK